MNVRKFVSDRMKAAGEPLLPSVRPLMIPDEHGDPLPAGSAVLMWHRGKRYLVSAAHVLDEYEDRQYYLGTESDWIEIPGPFVVNKLPPSGNREDDLMDFGFRLVEDELAEKLDGCHFLTANQIGEKDEPDSRPPRRSKYLAIGYPLNRFEYRWRDQVTTPKNLSYLSTAAQPKLYTDLGVTPKTHVLIDFDHEAVVGPKGVQQAPKLTGMSGGGIFVMPGLREPGIVALPQFVGVTIQQRKDKKLLIGIRIAVLLQAIELYRNATAA